MVDTVEHASATPDQPQPFHELGLKDDEYQRICEILGRRPTDTELAMYSVMWSEHCSYKSSKVHLRYFGETTTDEMRTGMLAGIGENAGLCTERKIILKGAPVRLDSICGEAEIGLDL